MGQKVNPQILRLGILYNWNSRWFDEKRYKDVLIEDYKLRSALMNRLKINLKINCFCPTKRTQRPSVFPQ